MTIMQIPQDDILTTSRLGRMLGNQFSIVTCI